MPELIKISIYGYFVSKWRESSMGGNSSVVRKSKSRERLCPNWSASPLPPPDKILKFLFHCSEIQVILGPLLIDSLRTLYSICS